MSLNCLTCQVLQRTDSSGSERNYKQGKARKACNRKLCCVNMDRSWSGNLTPPPYYETIDRSAPLLGENGKKKKNAQKAGHRRLCSTGGVAYEGSTEPKLVRSAGMRRDWSFENLGRLRKESKGRNLY
ncbi:hypothetical protein RchiOBHm_Chr7g0209741 [Rosa chinensis]|uniref:Uncharacterized protein n=1 Tax=Rosa chinensis TaxID=74649 RepID=A0A2P6PA08_ROSCH|nr:uncharacterized protein LOC112177712 [Rosa chinensis]PRQ18770.1 hypothetical protein RchiOBHm_Chr7g0209741 [Rosa chinensis]